MASADGNNKDKDTQVGQPITAMIDAAALQRRIMEDLQRSMQAESELGAALAAQHERTVGLRAQLDLLAEMSSMNQAPQEVVEVTRPSAA